MSSFKILFPALKRNPTTATIQTTQTSALISHEFEGFVIKFILNYKARFENYVAATYDEPDEFDIYFDFIEVDSILVFHRSNSIGLTDKQEEKVKQLILKHLLQC